MEGNKSAMYEQAGRNRGWTQGYREETTVIAEKQVAIQAKAVKSAAPAATVPAAIPAVPVIPVMPEAVVVPVTPIIPHIPAPPVVIAPEMEKPAEACQTLAMAYTAMQKWQELYEPEQGLSRGTIFAELDLPFVGEGACRHE